MRRRSYILGQEPPDGKVLAGPIPGEERILITEIDFSVTKSEILTLHGGLNWMNRSPADAHQRTT